MTSGGGAGRPPLSFFSDRVSARVRTDTRRDDLRLGRACPFPGASCSPRISPACRPRRAADPRTRPLLRRRALPPPGRPVVAGSRLADRILAFDPATRPAARRGGPLAPRPGLDLPAARLVPAGHARHAVRDARRHGRRRRPRQEPPRRRHLRRHVAALRLRVADGEIVECSRAEHPELFRATLGGMGLTGHILEVEFRLVRIPSPWIVQESERVADIDAFLAALDAVGAPAGRSRSAGSTASRGGAALGPRHPDARALGRAGRGAARGSPQPLGRLAVPFHFPAWVLGRLLRAAFNALYFRSIRRRRAARRRPPRDVLLSARRHPPLEPHLRPARLHAVPVRAARARSGRARPRASSSCAARAAAPRSSACIKDCGAEGEGMLSFPRPGISIALDLPVRPEHARAGRAAQRAASSPRAGASISPRTRFTRAEQLPRRWSRGCAAFQRGRGALGPRAAVCAARSRSACWGRSTAMKVVSSGRRRGMGRALARLLAARGDRLFLLGRDERRARAQRAPTSTRAPAPSRQRRGGARAICSSRTGFAPALERAARGARADRHRGRHRRAVRHARTSSRPTGARAPAARGRLHEHRALLRGGAPNGCSPPAAARSASSARSPASAAASRSCSTAPPRPGSRATSRGSTTVPRAAACASSA